MATTTRPPRTTPWRAAHARSAALVPAKVAAKTKDAAPHRPRQQPVLAQLLDAAREELTWAGTLTTTQGATFLGWGSPHAVTVAALWAAHTHVRRPCSDPDHIKKKAHAENAPGVLAWPATPRLGIFAAPQGESGTGEGSGKTELAKLVLGLSAVPRGELQSTGPGLSLVIGLEHATTWIDEGADYFTGRQHIMSRSLLEDGYSQSELVQFGRTRMYGNQLSRPGENFGPAGLSTLASPEFLGSAEMKPFLSRFIRLDITQAPRGFALPQLTAQDIADFKTISATFTRYLMPLAATLATATFTMPSYMLPREAQIWSPLFKLAGFADAQLEDAGRARHWVKKAQAAADWFTNGGAEKARLENDLQALQAQLRARRAERAARGKDGR